MATAVERMRAHRERARRGLRRLTVDVSETDLQAIAERGMRVPQAPITISRRKLCRPIPQRRSSANLTA